jgi:hypothetical protein
MTRRDYVLLSDALRIGREAADKRAPSYTVGADIVIRSVGDFLAMNNPRFERDRFVANCGVPS